MKTAKTTSTATIKETRMVKKYFGPALLSKSRNVNTVAAEITEGHIFENKRHDKYIVTTAEPTSIILTVLDQKGNPTTETRRFSRQTLASFVVNNIFANTNIARRELFLDCAATIENNRLLHS